MNVEEQNRLAADLWATHQFRQNQSAYSGIRHSAAYAAFGIVATRFRPSSDVREFIRKWFPILWATTR
jgi:hypothetical protein